MSERILLINDEANIREIITLCLKQKPYDVTEASDGPSGLIQAEKILPDLILLDIMMPGMNGYEVCQSLKQNPKTKDIPVIFLSSLIEPKDKIKGLEVGAVDFVNRMTDRGELLARVDTHLKMSSLTKQLIEKNQQLLQKQKHLDEDLSVAAAIQRSLLPSDKLNIRNVDAAWRCLPCELIGGDIFNIIQIDELHVVFYMLDVSGHGVPSAMVTVSISEFLHQYSRYSPKHNSKQMLSPKAILESLNEEFPFERFCEFFTIFYMVLNTQTGELHYSNGGHPPPIVLHPDQKFNLLQSGDAAIGISPSSSFVERVELAKNAKVVIYTDGIVECQNSAGELYGSEEFYQFLENNKQKTPSQIVDLVCSEMNQFGQNEKPKDDISIMVVQFGK